MKQLTCEMCGSTDLMKQDGVFVCQTCGCKYSVEEAKKMMVEGTVSVSGSVQTDSAHLVQNFLDMAQNAYASNNKEEAENYCNKIIEIIPTHQQAWLLKGRAAGWQSTLSNIRFSEAINCFANAIEYTDEDEKGSIIEECKQEVSELAKALLRVRGERFAKWPDEEERTGFISDLTVVLQAILQFFKTVGALINKDELMAPLAKIINNSVIDAWNNVVRPTFANDHDGYPDDYELKKLFERARYCTDLLEQAIDLSDADDEEDIQYYKNLISIHEYLINANSYSYETVHVGYSSWDASSIYENKYVKSKSLTDEAKRQRRQLISKYQNKIKSIESAVAAKKAAEKAEKERIAREEAQKRYDVYWAEHAEEKAALESEKESLNEQLNIIETECNDQVNALNKEIADIPGKTEITNLEERIAKLNAEKESLGIFKGKQKKALQEEIDNLSTEKRNIQSRMSSAKSELEKKIRSIKADAQKKAARLQSRRTEIEKELCVERFFNNGTSVNVVDSNEAVPSSDFVFIVEDVFSVTGRGTVATGIVEIGQISLGESVKIYRQNGEVKSSRITGIEKFREKNLDTANQGDAVGLLLRGIQSVEVGKGDKIIK